MSLLRSLLLRLLGALLTVVAVSAITWLLFYALRRNLIDDGRSLPTQLGDHLQRTFLHFDLGRSADPSGTPVAEMLRERLPADLVLLGGGLTLGVALGGTLGALAALRPRGLLARALEVVALLAFGTPVFVVGLSALLLFGAGIASLLPLGIPLTYVEFDQDPAGWLQAILVPWLVLALPLAGQTFRLMAGTTVSALDEPWVQTAEAKGLTHRRIVLRHAARAGLGPTATLAGAATNVTLLNLALVEKVFSVPGFYADFDQAVGTADVQVLLALAAVTAALVVSINALVDVLVRVLDPRIRGR